MHCMLNIPAHVGGTNMKERNSAYYDEKSLWRIIELRYILSRGGTCLLRIILLNIFK